MNAPPPRFSWGAVFGALLLSAAALVALWLTEGRTNWARVAERAAVAPPDRAGGLDGRAVTVTGTITSADPLGDPEFLLPGQYISLRRDVEQFAWAEGSTRSTDAPDGATAPDASGYYAAWTAEPSPSAGFRVPLGHDNPPMPVRSTTFVVPRAAVSVWNLDLARVSFDPDTVLPTALLRTTGRGLGCVSLGEYLYCGTGTADAPHVGDLRVRFTALRNGTVVTAVGRARAGTVAPLDDGGDPWIRVIVGDRAQAVGVLRGEYVNAGSLGHLVGFALLWLACALLLAPLAARVATLRALASSSRLVRALVTFPVALLLTGVGTLAARLGHFLFG